MTLIEFAFWATFIPTAYCYLLAEIAVNESRWRREDEEWERRIEAARISHEIYMKRQREGWRMQD